MISNTFKRVLFYACIQTNSHLGVSVGTCMPQHFYGSYNNKSPPSSYMCTAKASVRFIWQTTPTFKVDRYYKKYNAIETFDMRDRISKKYQTICTVTFHAIFLATTAKVNSITMHYNIPFLCSTFCSNVPSYAYT